MEANMTAARRVLSDAIDVVYNDGGDRNDVMALLEATAQDATARVLRMWDSDKRGTPILSHRFGFEPKVN